MRRSWTLAIVAVACAVALAGPRALAQEESCPDPAFTPQMLTPLAGRHPRDAAIVVGLVPGGSMRELPPIMLTRRRREIRMVPEAIAPGLYRLTPDTRRIWGRYHVSGVAGEPQMLFSRRSHSATPTAPRLQRVERYIVASADGSRTEVKAHFGFPVPQGVVAILAYWGEDESPDLFARAVPTSSEAVLFSQTGGCAVLPEGATPPPEEGQVRVAFVDQLGQVSQRSEAVPLGQ